MKQPELGKRIADLRKAKGLTQDELVNKCNITVRTLQRIESGSVTPRSYTVRMIFAALDYDINNLLESEPENRLFNTFQHKSEQFLKNVIDMFNLKTNTMRKISILSAIAFSLSFGLFFICSETKAQKTDKDKFVISNGRGITYLIPKEFRKESFISNTKDTAVYKMRKYLIQEYKYNIFLNKEFVGKVTEGDTVVLYKGKITIRKFYSEYNSGIGSGITYLFPKNLKVKNRSLNRDTVLWDIDRYRIKEFENKIFLNDVFIGKATSGDTIIFNKGVLNFKRRY